MPNVELFHFFGCPFCQKIRDYLKSKDIRIPMRDIHERPKNRDLLLEMGGKTQVPCLMIDGNPLYESDDIIKWFDENWKKTAA